VKFIAVTGEYQRTFRVSSPGDRDQTHRLKSSGQRSAAG
jgi:hypothetical protein